MAVSELTTEEELELLVKEYSEGLLRYCIGILENYADAQDAVQTTFIRAWKKRATLRKKTAIKSWLYRIAYRICIDELRQRRNTEELTDKYGLSYEQSFDTGLSEELTKALAALSPLDRAILEERILEEMSFRELSIIHCLLQTALRARYSRARKKVYGLLTQENREGESSK